MLINKDQIIKYIEGLETQAKQSDKYFLERNRYFKALSEIREICYGSDMSKQEYDKVLQIIDKYMKVDD